MLATLGDLVEDIVVRVDDPVRVASDTAARIERRRGGSAANTASVAALLGRPCRFLGQVGDDPIGGVLIAELATSGVDTTFVRRSGRTGTIIVLVDRSGERTMLTDRGASSDLDHPDVRWLENVTTLHVPMYGLMAGPLAATATTLIGWAHDRGIAVSVDVSSVALIEQLGKSAFMAMVTALDPAVLLANEDEARTLGITGGVAGAVTVIKRGAEPALVLSPAGRFEVPTGEIRRGADTTGAGDAFAAGFLTASWRTDIVAACESGHRAAALELRRGPG